MVFDPAVYGADMNEVLRRVAADAVAAHESFNEKRIELLMQQLVRFYTAALNAGDASRLVWESLLFIATNAKLPGDDPAAFAVFCQELEVNSRVAGTPG